MAEECGECGATFGSAAELVAHVKEAHATAETATPIAPVESEAPTLTCVYCGATFHEGGELADHLRQAHPIDPGTETPA